MLRALAEQAVAGLSATLVTPAALHHYSAMVPGYLQDQYVERELVIDLGALAARGGVRLVVGTATALSAAGREVTLSSGERIPFDVCSLDLGSDAAGAEVPGMREHASTLRPMSRAVELKARLEACIAAPGGPLALVVVGGGAGGVEVAFALARRLREAGRAGVITIVDESPILLQESPRATRALVRHSLHRAGVCTALGSSVVAVERDQLRLASGARLSADLTVWLGGAAAPAMLRQSDLPLDDAGFLLVDERLQSVDGAPVWGAGDCVTLAGHPGTPKAGVFAVRQGPVLAKNLLAALGAGRARRYRPQRRYLSLLNSADGRAILRWGGLRAHGRWAWMLKDRIDRRFVSGWQG